jgi:hypothetical protein
MSLPLKFTTMTIQRTTVTRLSKLRKFMEVNGKRTPESWDALLNRMADCIEDHENGVE